jgi:hypothetical protein
MSGESFMESFLGADVIATSGPIASGAVAEFLKGLDNNVVSASQEATNGSLPAVAQNGQGASLAD